MTFSSRKIASKCKYMDCVEVCRSTASTEGDNMLVIHPDECHHCGVCEQNAAEPISPDTQPGLESWLKLNAEYAQFGQTSRSGGKRPLTPRRSTVSPTSCRTFLSEPGPGRLVLTVLI